MSVTLLVAAKEAVLQIEYLHHKFQETASGNQVLAKLRVAIADAEREEYSYLDSLEEQSY